MLTAPMAFQNPAPKPLFFFFLSTILLVSLILPGIGAAEDTIPLQPPNSNSQPMKVMSSKGSSKEGLQRRRDGSGRRVMIGSVAPTCTYNECRGCRFKCSAEQVPVDGSDPVNSAYHYRCVCHR